MICGHCDGIRMPVYSPRTGWEVSCPKCGRSESCAPAEGLEAAAMAAGEGRNFYAIQEFDEAKRRFDRAAELSGGHAAYRWAALLAEYGVKYCASEVEDGGYAVNFWKRELPQEPLAESAGYRELYRVAAQDLALLQAIQREAEEIGEGLSQIRRLAASGVEWDVFMCYKDMDTSGGHTPERVLLDGVYPELAGSGLKVFFAPRTMAGKMVSDFEGYIYTALKTARLMVLAGSSRENVNAQWVTSEWERFRKWGKRGQIVLCPVGDMRMSDFPRSVSKVQTPLAMGVQADRVNDPMAAKWMASEIRELYSGLSEEQRDTEEEARRDAEKAQRDAEKTQRDAEKTQRDAEKTQQTVAVKTRWIAKEEKRRTAQERVSQVDAQQWAAEECRLGLQYLNGSGLQKNPKEAMEHFLNAANQGYARAQYFMGWCYENGEGVRRNRAEALGWYRLAAAQGEADAERAMERLQNPRKKGLFW